MSRKAPRGFANQPPAAAKVSGGGSTAPLSCHHPLSRARFCQTSFLPLPSIKRVLRDCKAQTLAARQACHWSTDSSETTSPRKLGRIFAFRCKAQLDIWLPTWAPSFSQATLKPDRPSPSLRLSLYSSFLISHLKLDMQEKPQMRNLFIKLS